MSNRKRKQQGLAILVLSLFVALIAGSAGFATGYGADAAKRKSLSEEVSVLREKTENVGMSAEQEESVLAENEALKSENEELNKKVSDLTEQLGALQKDNEELKNTNVISVDEDETALDPVERNGETEDVPSNSQDEVKRVSLVDKITKYAIIIIVVILVIMGLCMFFFSRRDDDYEYDDEEYEDEDADETNDEMQNDADEVKEEEKEEVIIEEPTREIVLPEKEATEENSEAFSEETMPFDMNEETKVSASDVPDTLEELMAKSPSAVRNDD